MKLADLLEYWNVMVHSPRIEGNIEVSRQVGEATYQAIARLYNVQEAVDDLHDLMDQDLE
jgi:hypothetical protein